MAQIIWSNSALEDLQSIYDYIAQDSTKYANRLIDKIVDRVEILPKFPKIGRKVPEFDNELIRELIEGNYRIIYRIEKDKKIGIVTIHHSSRQLKNL